MSLRPVLFALLPLVTACGAATLPPAQLSESQASVRAAEELGANEYPQGSLYLKRARDNLALANRLADEGDETEATRALVRAETDADIALAVAQAERAREALRRSRSAVMELRDSAAQ